MRSGDFTDVEARTSMARMTQDEKGSELLADIGRALVAVAVLALLALLDRVA